MKYYNRFKDADSLHQACVCRDSMHLLLGALHYCFFFSGMHRGNFSKFRMEDKGDTTTKSSAMKRKITIKERKSLMSNYLNEGERIGFTSSENKIITKKDP